MRTRLASFPIAICALVLLCSGTAIAKDKDLLSAMVDLERAYIPALFLTGAENEALAPAAMDAYVATWLQFYADYGNYRPSYRNWKSYLDEINFHVEMASELVIEGALLEAHEEHMELIRKIMHYKHADIRNTRDDTSIMRQGGCFQGADVVLANQRLSVEVPQCKPLLATDGDNSPVAA